MKKILRWALIYLLLIVGLFLILIGAQWYLVKQREVRLGLAKPTFPYFKYSQEELNKLYPQFPNENVPTRTTPEETYAKFIAALKAGDLDKLELLFTTTYFQEYLSILDKAKKAGELEEVIKKVDHNLLRKATYGNYAQYIFADDIAESSLIEFEKDSNGDWKIKSL